MTLPQYTPARSIVPLRNRPAWNALQEHFDKTRDLHLRQFFADDPQRNERFTLEALSLYFDFSKNRITSETFRRHPMGSARHRQEFQRTTDAAHH